MAEPRRIQLTTLSCDVLPFSDGSASARNSFSGVPEEKETRSSRSGETRAVRLVLKLFDPDERSFPEFNYCQLVDKEICQTDDAQLSRHEQEKKKENDEIAAVARKLEEKYGGKHKKKDRIQDLIDIGYGYDDEDSFIDNSEAYDEFVPSSLTTKFGGFYVNSGVLQFRQASDTEADDPPMEEKTFEPTKKRKENGELDRPKKKQHRTSEERKIDMGPKLSTLSVTGADEKGIKKKKKTVKTLSVTSMLKKFQREKEKERQRLEKATVSAPAPHLFPADAAGGGGSLGLTDPLLSLIGSTTDHALIQAASTVDFDIDLDSLLDVSEDPLSQKSLPPTATETQLTQTGADEQTQLNVLPDTEAQVGNTKSSPQLKLYSEPIPSESSSSSAQCAPLPEGLPPGLEDNIRKLIMAAKTSEGESKLKFFNPDINSILLDIELQCQGQGGQLRSKVYRHLSSFMPCCKDTLLKRVKKLLITHAEENPTMENPLQKLKEAIERSMPEQIASFNESCQVYEQVKTLKAAEEENMEEKGGRKGGPKKLFKWNPEIRECLSHVLRGKMDQCKEGQEMEEYIKILLDSDVKPLWPKGWMQSRVLIRESKKLLGLTSLTGNKAKSIKGTSSISGSSKPSDGSKSLEETLVLSEVPQRADLVLTEVTDMSSRMSLSVDQKEDAALKKGEVKVELGAHFSSLVVGNNPPVNASASIHSVLADEAHEQPLTLSPNFFAAAVAKHWNFCMDSSCPPLPPPPPQSSPVDFPISSVRQAVLPGLLQAGEM